MGKYQTTRQLTACVKSGESPGTIETWRWRVVLLGSKKPSSLGKKPKGHHGDF
jgi:hypothetical protein